MKEIQQSIWRNTKSLLVFYVYIGHEEFNDFRASLDSLLIESNIKRLRVIIQIADPKDSVLKHSLFSYISDRDIALLGNKLKKRTLVDGQENVEMIISTHFDLFMCFGSPSKKIIKWLSKVNTIRKIGINTDNHPFFDMNFKSSIESMDKSVSFAINTLNKII